MAMPRSHPLINAIRTSVRGGHFIQALKLYAGLWNNGHRPDRFTFPYVLKASSQRQDPTAGFSIHNHVLKAGFQADLYATNGLILFYSRFNRLDDMQRLFDEMSHRNVVTWTAVISAYANDERFGSAIDLFHGMQADLVRPNSFTLAAIIPGFFNCKGVMQVHGFAIKSGFEHDVFVSTALVDSYGRCGHAKLALRCFRAMPERNVVSWNAMILRCNQSGKAREALQLFVEMLVNSNLRPDTFTIVAVLNSSSLLASLRHGRETHCYVYRAGMEQENFVSSALIDMYGKCGDFERAQRVFDSMPERDASSWTALITCYGLHGHGRKAIAIFERMKQTSSVLPNSITFTAVLSACSHAGHLQDGIRYFKSMSADFGIDPTTKHYACIVDMLGRAGQLTEALNFIETMPVRAHPCVWEALLGAAAIQGDMVVGGIAGKQLLCLEPENLELHGLLSAVYAKASKWYEVEKIRGRIRLKGAAGASWIQTLQRTQD